MGDCTRVDSGRLGGVCKGLRLLAVGCEVPLKPQSTGPMICHQAHAIDTACPPVAVCQNVARLVRVPCSQVSQPCQHIVLVLHVLPGVRAQLQAYCTNPTY